MNQVQDNRGRYATKDPADIEKISWTYWDRQTVTSGTTTVLNFFQAVPANKLLGNIPLAGQLPSDQDFEIHNIRFDLVSDAGVFSPEAVNADPSTLGDALHDLEQIIMNGFGTIRIQNKDYGEWPLKMLPAGGGPWGAMSLASGATAATFGALTLARNGVPDARNVYVLRPPLMIPAQTNFLVRAEWPTAPTLRGGNQAVEFSLDGIIYRPKQ